MKILSDRTLLLQVIDKLPAKGGFAEALGKAALLADNENLQRLVIAFPEIFKNQDYIRLVK